MEQELQTRSRQYQGGPQVTYISLVLFPIIGGALWDLAQQLPFPCNTFYLSSVKSGDELDSIVMYFQPTGNVQGTPFNTLKGSEQIFYLTSNLATGPIYRGVLRFKEPVLNFFLAAGSENGHLPNFTLACTNDDELELYGGLYT